MSDLILHRGGQEVKKEELDLVPLPEATDTYVPVSHYELANTLTKVGNDILTDYTLIGENYALARNGNQMFAVLKFQNDNSEMALSVGFRNSYDQSMSVGFCVGASVFVCDNLALSGEIAVMKKHTKNVWDSLQDLAITTLYKSGHKFIELVEDSEALKSCNLNDDKAYQMLGLLYGRGVLSPRQLPVVRDEWLKPQHPEFEPRNAWSFYNACTQALKSCPPINVMERHCRLHDTMKGGL